MNLRAFVTNSIQKALQKYKEKSDLEGVPMASSTARGGIKLGYTQNGRNYPVKAGSDGKAYVSVPQDSSVIPQTATLFHGSQTVGTAYVTMNLGQNINNFMGLLVEMYFEDPVTGNMFDVEQSYFLPTLYGENTWNETVIVNKCNDYANFTKTEATFNELAWSVNGASLTLYANTDTNGDCILIREGEGVKTVKNVKAVIVEVLGFKL